MREVDIKVWCDWHEMNDGTRVEGAPMLVAFTGRMPLEIDLCAECVASMILPLQELLDKVGQVPEQPSPVATGRRRSRVPTGARHGKVPNGARDKVCLYDGMSYASDSGLKQHLNSQHGVNLLGDMYGDQCPLCGDGPYPNIGAHTGAAHGLSRAGAFAAAFDDGDPYGVVAARSVPPKEAAR